MDECMTTTRDVFSTDSGVEPHRHCQATVLSAYGPNGGGMSWDEITKVINGGYANNLPENWTSFFTSNRDNITQDLAGILKIINQGTGELKQLIQGNTDAIGKLGRDIILTLNTGSTSQNFKFNTIKQMQGEKFSVTIPTVSINVGTGLSMNSNTISLKIANPNELGGIKVGDGLSIDASGKLSAQTTSIMTTVDAGIAKVGSGLKMTGKNKDVLSINIGQGLNINTLGQLSANQVVFPTMSNATSGMAKSGDGLTVDGGVLKVDNTIARVDSPSFTGVPTSPTPTESSPKEMIVNKGYLDKKIDGIKTGVTLDQVYPVGSIYITVMSELPPSFTNSGMVWVKLNTGRCLWNAENESQLGQNIVGSLPNITGTFPTIEDYDQSKQDYRTTNYTGAFKCDAHNVSAGEIEQKTSSIDQDRTVMDASRNNPIYSGSAGQNVVRPTSIGVTMWKRTS